jgi:hypothetical protein
VNVRDRLRQEFIRFAEENSFLQKGPLCVALVLTDKAKTQGLPLDESNLSTRGGGQVRGLGKAAVQRILHRHGILRVLAEEGGRTSRGSIDKARMYVHFLNRLHAERVLESSDLDDVEAFWVDRVREFFAARPFVLRIDAAASIRAMVKDLLTQARAREREYPGATVVGTVLQHLVGAKLEIITGDSVQRFGASVADASTERAGDFVVGDVVVHVTSAPGEALIRKCKRNLEAGLRAWTVTIPERVSTAQSLAEDSGLAQRVDLCDIEQFLTCNLMERGNFTSEGRRNMAVELVDRYNEIIEQCEGDPSLRIELQ